MTDTVSVVFPSSGHDFTSLVALVVALIGLIGGLTSALMTALLSARISDESRLSEALRWFEGKTQPRSVGVSVVQANWDKSKKLRPAWAGVLHRQAIYLLFDSDEHGKQSEKANLQAIMALLCRSDVKDRLTDEERWRLGWCLEQQTKALAALKPESQNQLGVGLTFVPTQWTTEFPAPKPGTVT